MPKKSSRILDEIDKQRETDKQVEAVRRKAEIANLKTEVQRLLKEHDVAQRRMDLILSVKARRSTSFHIPRSVKSGSEGASVMVLSDVHLEENVDPSTMNNMNEYSLAIARDSVKRFFANGLRLHEIFRRDIKLNQIVLAILGDIISGYIHPELVEDNNLSPTQSILEAKGLLGAGIQHLLDNTKAKITIVCKFGNHGRTTEKPRISTEYKNNYEWMMYHMLASEFISEPRVKFIIDNGYLTYLTLFDRFDIRFHHGHAIRYKDGIGGITIPVNKAIAQWDKERPAYLDVFGHHHQQMLDAGKFVANGSVIGYNPYAIRIRAAYQRPEQSYFIIDAQRGKTVCAPILVRPG